MACDSGRRVHPVFLVFDLQAAVVCVTYLHDSLPGPESSLCQVPGQPRSVLNPRALDGAREVLLRLCCGASLVFTGTPGSPRPQSRTTFTCCTFLMLAAARLAQSAERKALNLVVVGSRPTVGVLLLKQESRETKIFKTRRASLLHLRATASLLTSVPRALHLSAMLKPCIANFQFPRRLSARRLYRLRLAAIKEKP